MTMAMPELTVERELTATLGSPLGDALGRRYWPAATALLVAALGLLLLLFHGAVAQWRFSDPDDLMRLQEVRDWMAGQSWFEVTQYRIAPPAGLPMHWSRLLDVPLAAVIALTRPMLGEGGAELAACVAVPMLTFAVITVLTAAVTRRMLEDRAALIAIVYCAFDIGLYSVARPMRIDHHGWQVACGVGMVLALIGERTTRRALIAGLLAAMWMHISLEGIVFTAACGAWLGCRWTMAPQTERSHLPLFLLGVTAGSLLLFLVAHGGALFDRTACDAVSPVHMTLFALATIGTVLATRLTPSSLVARGAALSVTAIACAAVYRLWAPQCAGGPFSMLGPLGYRLWYLSVAEGLPAWTRGPQVLIEWTAFPLLGLLGALVGWRHAAPERRAMHLDYAVLLAAATAIGFLVLRACALANALAVPGAIMLLIPATVAIRRIGVMPARVLATVLVLVALSPILPLVAVNALAPQGETGKATPGQQHVEDCEDLANLRHLNAMPPSIIMTSIETAPAMIVASHHSAIGASYHRGAASIEDVLRFYTADDATARAVLGKYQARLVMLCPGNGEVGRLTAASPQGLAARLSDGRAPDWLRPVTVPGLRYAKVWRVID